MSGEVMEADADVCNVGCKGMRGVGINWRQFSGFSRYGCEHVWERGSAT